METGSLRVVHIDDQRWVVRAVRLHAQRPVQQELSLRFFNGAESRYLNDYPADWPVMPESDLTSLFQRAEPKG
jgi:hypothetical protein